MKASTSCVRRARVSFYFISGEKFVIIHVRTQKKNKMERLVENGYPMIFEPLLASFFVSLVSLLAVVGVTPILALASTLSSALFDDHGKKTKKMKKKKKRAWHRRRRFAAGGGIFSRGECKKKKSKRRGATNRSAAAEKTTITSLSLFVVRLFPILSSFFSPRAESERGIHEQEKGTQEQRE